MLLFVFTCNRYMLYYRDNEHPLYIHHEHILSVDHQCSRNGKCRQVFLCCIYRNQADSEHSLHMDSVHTNLLFVYTKRIFRIVLAVDYLRLSNGLHMVNGSPVISLGQEQTGVKPRNSQFAPIPQAPSHGFLQEL